MLDRPKLIDPCRPSKIKLALSPPSRRMIRRALLFPFSSIRLSWAHTQPVDNAQIQQLGAVGACSLDLSKQPLQALLSFDSYLPFSKARALGGVSNNTVTSCLIIDFEIDQILGHC